MTLPRLLALPRRLVDVRNAETFFPACLTAINIALNSPLVQIVEAQPTLAAATKLAAIPAPDPVWLRCSSLAARTKNPLAKATGILERILAF